MNRKERVRFESCLLVLCGCYHTYDQWTRVLLPFSQWSLEPRPDMYGLLLLNALGSAFIFGGTFLVAQMIESHGMRRTAIVCTALTAIYQMLIPHVTNYYAFLLLESLLIFNHTPMIIDTAIVYLEGEDGDDKRRTILISKLTVPMSLGFALGPYIALQVLFLITTSLEISQTLCGIIHLLTVIPLCYVFLPESDSSTDKPLKAPSIESYKAIILNQKIKWCLGLLMMVVGPYTAYDQVIRISIANDILQNPHNMTQLFVILGGTTICVNIFLLPRLQAKYGPQQILIGAFSLSAFSYLYLSQTTNYYHLLIGMPLQLIGVSICFGELSSQILSTVNRQDSGKVAALMRMAQQLATTMTPLVTGVYVDNQEVSILCYTSVIVSLAAIPILYRFGRFMKAHAATLPMTGKLD